MKKQKKVLALVLCAVMLVASSVLATMAYLTAQTDVVKNTFTVGNVVIDLDEAKVDVYGDGSVDVYKDCSFCTGIGFGVDFVFHEHISVPLAIGYLANMGDTISADFSISTGFRYRF